MNKKEEGEILKINPKIYNLRVVYSCAYVFLDKAYVFLDGDPKKEIIVRISSKNGKNQKQIVGEFKNELLNAALRNEISKENIKLREAIVSSALFSSSEERKSDSKGGHTAVNKAKPKTKDNCKDNKIEDPLGIAIPWEEKYGKK